MIIYRIIATRFNEEYNYFDYIIFDVAKTKEECENKINKLRRDGYMIDIVLKGEELEIEYDEKTPRLYIKKK